jgi:hypothetical protein
MGGSSSKHKQYRPTITDITNFKNLGASITDQDLDQIKLNIENSTRFDFVHENITFYHWLVIKAIRWHNRTALQSLCELFYENRDKFGSHTNPIIDNTYIQLQCNEDKTIVMQWKTYDSWVETHPRKHINMYKNIYICITGFLLTHSLFWFIFRFIFWFIFFSIYVFIRRRWHCGQCYF